MLERCQYYRYCTCGYDPIKHKYLQREYMASGEILEHLGCRGGAISLPDIKTLRNDSADMNPTLRNDNADMKRFIHWIE